MINSRNSQCSRLKETAFIIRYFAEILKELSIQAFKCFLRLESFLGHNPMLGLSLCRSAEVCVLP